MSLTFRLHDTSRRGLTSLRSQNLDLTALSIAVITTAVFGASRLIPRAINDYREFLALGPGGPPYNVFGWALVTCILRPLSISRDQALSFTEYPSTGASEDVSGIKVRKGDRPDVRGIAPQRQMDQNPDADMKERVVHMFQDLATRNKGLLEWKRSHYERHNDALYVAQELLDGDKEKTSLPNTARVAKGEIGHPHADGSVHLYLSPADARIAVERGWAERHRLSVQGFQEQFGLGATYMLLYGARDEEEVEVMRVLLGASVIYMTAGTEVNI